MESIDNSKSKGKPNYRRRSESCLDRYFITPFFRRYSDFNGSDGRRTMLLSLAAFAIVTCGIAGLLTGLVGILGVETGMVCLVVLGIAWIIGLMIPLAAVCVRGMREPAEAPASDIARQRSKVRLVTIDIFVMTVCALFLIFGILNMVTTMNSEELNPERIVDDEPETVVTDSVVDEPIFTYQQIDAPTESDPLQGYEEETDTVSVTDSFDPTIEPAEKAEQEIVETTDSI